MDWRTTPFDRRLYSVFLLGDFEHRRQRIMPIFHDVEQRSEAWDRLRLGIPTSSDFAKIVTPSREPSKQWQALAYQKIAERLLARKIDHYTSPAMERGQIVEEAAANWYEFDQNVSTQKIGFITDNAVTMGCSPDRFVGTIGLLEVKCPLPHTQIQYLLTGKAQRQYMPQLQGQLLIAEREWVDILCWHDELPRTVVRVQRDEHFIALLRSELRKFNEFVEGVMIKIGSVETRQPKDTLRDMLHATLEASP